MEIRLFESPFNPGYSRSDWQSGWQKLKESNIYEVDFFGDMILPTIACGLRKNILIFNTNINNPRTPISVISPVEFGLDPDSRIPIVLAYDLVHYESLHPKDQTDIEKTIDLVNLYKEGNYQFTHSNLADLVSLDTSMVQQTENFSKKINCYLMQIRNLK